MNKTSRMDEGYIKFKALHSGEQFAFAKRDYDALNHARDLLYQERLIGMYPNGIGFGNISMRMGANRQFIISGSATGGIAHLDPCHYALVEEADCLHNTVKYKGSTPASSESMSHAAIYDALESVCYVVHVHHRGIWKAQKGLLPTIPEHIPYGSPEMAQAISELVKTTAKPSGIFITAGHEEGVFAFGQDLTEVLELLLKYLK